jgi:hypothetical protein
VDLARARLLPIRQAIGQYLSGIPFELLRKDLCEITVHYAPSSQGEAFHLMQWLEHCLKCEEEKSIVAKLSELEPNSNQRLSFEITYSHEKFIRWIQFEGSSISHLTQNIDGEEKDLPIQIKPMLPEQELSEAFYF